MQSPRVTPKLNGAQKQLLPIPEKPSGLNPGFLSHNRSVSQPDLHSSTDHGSLLTSEEAAWNSDKPETSLDSQRTKSGTKSAPPLGDPPAATGLGLRRITSNLSLASLRRNTSGKSQQKLSIRSFWSGESKTAVDGSAVRNRPMTFWNHPNPQPNDCPDKDFEIQSLKSVDEDISSKLGTDSTPPAVREAAVEYLVKTFADDKGLLDLYKNATSRLGGARFIQNHRRLLKRYYLDLNSLEKTPSQKLAVEFLRPRNTRVQISSQIYYILSTSGANALEKIQLRLDEKKEPLLQLDRFLAQGPDLLDRFLAQGPDLLDSLLAQGPDLSTGFSSASTIRAGFEDVDDIDLEASECGSIKSEASESDDELEGIEGEDEPGQEFALPKLELAIEFLTAGQPFSSYKENLRTFLKPNLAETCQKNGMNSIRSYLSSVSGLWNGFMDRILGREDLLEPGMKRVRWTCVRPTVHNAGKQRDIGTFLTVAFGLLILLVYLGPIMV